MNCLVACVIWIGGYGYNDSCPAKVRVRYKTDHYYYVTVLQGPTIENNAVKMDVPIHQRVAKPDCK